MLITVLLCFAFILIFYYKMTELVITDFNGFVNTYMSENSYGKILIPFGLFGFLWSPIYILKYFKTIRIYPSNIEVNYFFPIFNHNLQLKDFDYYILVDEMTRSVPVEAIWFIKDKKVKFIIPGQLYSNYYEIRNEISKYSIENKGKIKLNPFQEVKARLGFRINKISLLK